MLRILNMDFYFSAACVPPEKQRPKAMRKHWNRLNNPGRSARIQNKKVGLNDYRFETDS